MKIRAHHLLCMNSFKGKGYSKEFVSNFYNVLKRLNKNYLVEVINYPDDICESCPHMINNKCVKNGKNTELKVSKKDEIVMKHLGIKLHQSIHAKELFKLAHKYDDIRQICKDCEWIEYCK